MDEQVLPLSLSPALSIFTRRGLLPFCLTFPSGFTLDPSSETPLDLLELSPGMAGWVDPTVARTLTMLDGMDAATLDELEISFTLPGDDTFELIPGGAQTRLTRRNLGRYQRRVGAAILYESAQLPLRLLTMGFADVVPPGAFCMLEEEELMGVLCGAARRPGGALWTEEEIRAVLIGDHGYRSASPQLSMLAHILGARFSHAQQRAFLQFCTGCPALPLGGVAALGAITVVRGSAAGPPGLPPLFNPSPKTFPADFPREASGESQAAAFFSSTEDTTSADEIEWPLPSVNTCFRYLKLPPYPTEELMMKKLLLSISYSGDTFELS
ncbi:unnamed protein product [Phytomonas sp. Hart1]|nr:unnamed protein product [Phytomonas sp. Hart1]|eukprot:CCW69447.1 unnamed protein product [Phytomonas sp. isolate Hart1]